MCIRDSHIPEQSLYPSVCLSLYVLPCWRPVWPHSPTMTEIVWKCHIPERFLYPFVCLSVCLSLYVYYVDDPVFDNVRLLCVDVGCGVRCHIPEWVLWPSVFLSVCLSQSQYSLCDHFTYCVWTADIARDVIYQSVFSIRPGIISTLSRRNRLSTRKVRDRKNVTYRNHYGGGWYVSVTSGFNCIDLRKF